MKKTLFLRPFSVVLLIGGAILTGSCTLPLLTAQNTDIANGAANDTVQSSDTSAGVVSSEQGNGTQNVDADDFDPFRNAVETALEATELNGTAQTSKEWRAVAEKWQQAIELMKAVPKSHEKYEVAQQRAFEAYPTNLAYAQGKAGEDALPEFTTDDDKMTKVDFGEGWPFVVDGELVCERISAGEYVVDLVTLNSLGQVYAVNLSAQSRAQEHNWRNIDEIWRDSPLGEGKVPINWVIWRGEALCNMPPTDDASKIGNDAL